MKFRLLAGLVCLIAGCTSTPENSHTTASASALTVVYQQGREGQLEPCGCHTTPYGGIDRELNALKAIRASNPTVLYVDAGNLYAPSESKATLELYRQRGETLTQVLNEMGLDVYGPGPSDFGLGLDFLKSMEKAAKFKFVSTNVLDSKGQAVFATSQIVDVKGTPVAVFAIVDEKTKLPAGLKAENPKKALEKALKEVGEKAKITILLSEAGKMEANWKLVEELPGLHIVVGNDPKRTVEQGSPRASSLVLDGHRFGYYLGKLTLDPVYPIKGFYSEELLKTNKSVLAGYEAALAKVTDAKRKADIEKRIADFKKTEIVEAAPGATRFENKLIGLDEKTYGQKNAFSEVMEKEKERVRKAALEGAAPKPKSKG